MAETKDPQPGGRPPLAGARLEACAALRILFHPDIRRIGDECVVGPGSDPQTARSGSRTPSDCV
jgi:hypothetical protein